MIMHDKNKTQPPPKSTKEEGKAKKVKRSKK